MPIPYFAIHSAKRVPSQSAGNTLHKKQPGKLAFQAAFCAKCFQHFVMELFWHYESQNKVWA